MKEVLVLMGSPRKSGNCDRLCDEFIRGAEESGHKTEKVYLRDKNIKDCTGCCVCQKNGGVCVQKDQMLEIYKKLEQADVIVLASPVYYYSWSSLIKRMIDRTVAVSSKLKNKTFYLISAGQAPTEEYMTTMIDCFRKYIGCFRGEGNKEGGYLFGYGTDKPRDVVGTEAMKQAYQMGKEV